MPLRGASSSFLKATNADARPQRDEADEAAGLWVGEAFIMFHLRHNASVEATRGVMQQWWRQLHLFTAISFVAVRIGCGSSNNQRQCCHNCCSCFLALFPLHCPSASWLKHNWAFQNHTFLVKTNVIFWMTCFCNFIRLISFTRQVSFSFSSFSTTITMVKKLDYGLHLLEPFQIWI